MTRSVGSRSVRWNVTEKDVEQAGDRLMTMLGFSVYRLSQPRATMQTSGLSDRIFTHRAKGLALFWEAKRPGAKQRKAQVEFEADLKAAGIEYVWGTSDVLVEWCRGRGLVV